MLEFHTSKRRIDDLLIIIRRYDLKKFNEILKFNNVFGISRAELNSKLDKRMAVSGSFLVNICNCGHFDCDHSRFLWFNPTQCKVIGCNCEKYLKQIKCSWKDAPESAIKGAINYRIVKDKGMES